MSDDCDRMWEIEQILVQINAQLLAQAKLLAQLQEQIQAQTQADSVVVTGNNKVTVTNDNAAVAVLLLAILGYSNGAIDGDTLKKYILELLKK